MGMLMLLCSPWLLQISHYFRRMATKNMSSSTLHEWSCFCVVPGYYRLVTLYEGWLQRMRVAAPFKNVRVAVQSLVTTDWSLYLRDGYKEC